MDIKGDEFMLIDREETNAVDRYRDREKFHGMVVRKISTLECLWPEPAPVSSPWRRIFPFSVRPHPFQAPWHSY
jgi:hypothetical protein